VRFLLNLFYISAGTMEFDPVQSQYLLTCTFFQCLKYVFEYKSSFYQRILLHFDMTRKVCLFSKLANFCNISEIWNFYLTTEALCRMFSYTKDYTFYVSTVVETRKYINAISFLDSSFIKE